jgi:hypothetical protein
MKHPMRTLSALIVSVGLLVLATAPLGATPQSAPKETTAKLLFALNTASGSFAPTGHTNQYTLTLAGVSPETVWFTDRPARQADSVATATALNMIGFTEAGEGPPNAVVTFHADATHHAVAVVLSSPVYDAGTATMTFQAELLRKPDQGLAGFNQRLDRSPPLAFTSASLFIDDLAVTIGADGRPVAQTQPSSVAPNGRATIYLNLRGSGGVVNVRAVHGAGNNCVSGANDPGNVTAGREYATHVLSVNATSDKSCAFESSDQKWTVSASDGSFANVLLHKGAGRDPEGQCQGGVRTACSAWRDSVSVCVGYGVGC